MPEQGREPLAAQIQREVVYSGVPISDILRRAKILASLLDNSEFKRWVNGELGGYNENDEIPDYRTLKAVNLGTYSGLLGQMIRNFPIPVSLLPDGVRKVAEHTAVFQSVKEIETLAANVTQGRGVTLPWPPEAVMLARDHVRLDGGSVLVEAWRPLTKGQMEGILDQVRNRLLDFLLELEQVDPEVMTSENAIRAVPRDTIQNIFITTILGGQNVVATGTDVT